MPLFLIGFMAAGKTSVGRAIAVATDRVFVDLDDEIGKAGESAASLVARDEPEFRRREAGALIDVIRAGTGARDYVLATGGGAAAYGDNLDKMRQAGCVIALGVDLEDARARSATGPTRPLLAKGEALHAARAPIYRRAHAVVDTTGKAIAQVADEVRAVERVWDNLPARHRGSTTMVALGDRSYPIVVADEIDSDLVKGSWSERLPIAGEPGVKLRVAGTVTSRVEVITDRNVTGSAPCMALPEALGVEPIVIEPGEASKTLATYEHLCNELIARGVDRASTIVALGGGVVGDLAGFVAATLFRGIRVIQVPTTILAMADAAIGGKTAVDAPAGKNLIGAFHQPALVMCGLDTLTTLPARERRAAFGELWKYALLDGPDLWKQVEACAGWAAGPDHVAPPEELRGVIQSAVAYKAAIVGRDERELTGHRALLNLGHTVGHAIESESGMLHGEAVALGLIAACRLSTVLCGTPAHIEVQISRAVAASGLDTDLDRWLTDDVLGRIRVDKKRVGDDLKFVAVREVGVCEPINVAVEDARRFLRSSRRT
jgi:shikimate kinase/3-dehydroquinate synthase